jgi:hypothetical protein
LVSTTLIGAGQDGWVLGISRVANFDTDAIICAVTAARSAFRGEIGCTE